MFFQEGIAPYIGYVPTDEAVAMLGETLTTTLFQGLIWGPNRGEPYEGLIYDRLGESDLRHTLLSAESINFTKQHRGRDCEIYYVFDQREGNVWQGRWELSNELARGTAWCITTLVDMTATDPTHLKALMAK